MRGCGCSDLRWRGDCDWGGAAGGRRHRGKTGAGAGASASASASASADWHGGVGQRVGWPWHMGREGCSRDRHCEGEEGGEGGEDCFDSHWKCNWMMIDQTSGKRLW